MPDIAFDLRYLKYAILAAETGSFRRTAEVLGISQSTLSRRVQLLVPGCSHDALTCVDGKSTSLTASP
ncbi:LysR family transcriptional regulator [Bradyrhizobium genosp. P]|uniref:LysR family transcriptional regulator n=1 Tax=Bradyrhizobium genosp. P TaxID=83641 RepID=UPI003CFAE208